MTKKKEFNQEERIEIITKLLEKGDLLTDGDRIVTERTHPETGQKMAVPVAVFLRKNVEDDDNVYLGTPTGLILFECNDFHKFAQEKAKETFLENFDLMLRQKSAVLNLSAAE